MSITTLLGLTLVKIEPNDGAVHFYTADDRHFVMHHRQDCCESVYIESVVGEWADLLGEPILLAQESTSPHPYRNIAEEVEAALLNIVPEPSDDSETWTFYKLATRKGYVDIRWHGSSNGYYSEAVDFEEL